MVQSGTEEDADICVTDPGHPVTLTVTAKLRALVDVVMGDAKLATVLRQELVSGDGERDLVYRFEGRSPSPLMGFTRLH